MTFSHFQITFQQAGICISPVILRSRRANAHLLVNLNDFSPWTSQRLLQSNPQVNQYTHLKDSCVS